MNASRFAVALNMLPKIGPVRLQRLLEAFATPEGVLSAPEALLCQVQGIPRDVARSICAWESFVDVEQELNLAEKMGVRIVTLFDEEYPASLRTIFDPPMVLYVKGELLNDEKSLAVVGSRQASFYGLNLAKRFSYELAEKGVTILSGLARGIDSMAHRGALEAKGRTVAVIGSGFCQLYPPENSGLADDIVDQGGAVVSEFPLRCPPSKTTFPLRNRIVSGWSAGTLVVEAPSRSGALITAHAAVDQGRFVFAVPGSIERNDSSGCHALIRQGATLVTCVEDIMEDMRWNKSEQAYTPYLFEDLDGHDSMKGNVEKKIMTGEEKLLMKALKDGADTIDALGQVLGLPIYEITPMLMRLQIRKLVIPLPGGRFDRA